jgi:hypothetical protein
MTQFINKGILNQFQIKMLMTFLMVFDHIDHIPHFITVEMASIFHVITRVVGVWFAFSAVEGAIKTSNLYKYTARLFLWAGVMLVGNLLFNFLYQTKDISVHNNIFMTLAAGVLMICALKKINNKFVSYLIAIVILLVGVLFTEGGMTMLPFMLITYLTYGKTKIRNICYMGLSLLLFAILFNHYGDIATTIKMLALNSDFMFIFVLPFIYLYNGERGTNSTFGKYFFYIFYPAHLWIIATIAYLSVK